MEELREKRRVAFRMGLRKEGSVVAYNAEKRIKKKAR